MLGSRTAIDDSPDREAALDALAADLEARPEVDAVLVSPNLDGIELGTTDGLALSVLLPPPGIFAEAPTAPVPVSLPSAPPPPPSAGWTVVGDSSLVSLSLFAHEFRTVDKGEWLTVQAEENRCPKVPERVWTSTFDTDGSVLSPSPAGVPDLEAVVASLDAGLICMTGHGGTRYADVHRFPRTGRFSYAREGLVATGQRRRATDEESLHDTLVQLAGDWGRDVVEDRLRITLWEDPEADEAWFHLSFTGGWIRAQLAGSPMPESIVVLDACNSGTFAEPMASCSASGVPNTFITRLDTAGRYEVLDPLDWADVCPMMWTTPSSGQRSTGWVAASLEFTAHDELVEDESRITFAINGYNARLFSFLIDDVKLERVR